MIEINNNLISDLFKQASSNSRFRMNYDLRTSKEDGGQRMLNALLPGTEVPVHRHPNSNESVILLSGKLVEILYEEVSDIDMNLEGVSSRKRLKETARCILDPKEGNYGCVVPAGVWHTVEVLEPSVIYEAKDGKYGEDGSESF